MNSIQPQAKHHISAHLTRLTIVDGARLDRKGMLEVLAHDLLQFGDIQKNFAQKPIFGRHLVPESKLELCLLNLVRLQQTWGAEVKQESVR